MLVDWRTYSSTKLCDICALRETNLIPPSQGSPRTDAELVQLTLDGQKSAFDSLVRRWSARVLGYVSARVRPSQSAEELTQEAFLKAYRSLASLQKTEKFGAWLLSIAHRLILDWRKAKPQHEVKMSELSDTHRANQVAGGQDPSELVGASERQTQLLAEIERLPTKLKEVLMIYYYDKVTYRDLAEMLNVSVATINQRLAQARQLLRERLSTLEGQP
jgi:RNA polymerase sigma-70 factor (ECF subfamily)